MKKLAIILLIFLISPLVCGITLEIPLNEFRFSQQEFQFYLPPESIIIDFSQSTTSKIEFNQFSFINESINNKKVAKFFKKGHKISITSYESLLGIPSVSSIFSVYFSFTPLRTEDGIILARLFSVNTTDKLIEVRLEGSKIVVDIRGIVFSREGENLNVKLITDEKIENNKPYEFSLVFDTINSKISIYLNGIESDRKIMRTANINLKNPEGVIEFFPEFFGTVEKIVIAPTFIRSLNMAPQKPQEYISRVIDTKNPSSRIKQIDINGKGKFLVFMKISSDINEILTNQTWLNIEEAKEAKGRYLQFRILPIQGEESHEFHSLKITLTDQIPPQKPTILFVTLEDEGAVTLHWQNELDEEVEYYEIFYGDYKNKYFGKEALNGPSPIKVKKPSKFYPILKYTIRGLHPNKEYFFAIRSVRKDLTKSEYSEEVKAIPSKTISKN